jgi:hypothetical protein
LVLVVFSTVVCHAASNVKIRGYVSARPDAQTILILDDAIRLSPSTSFQATNSSGTPLTLSELPIGSLIEVEGSWAAKHRFNAQKIECDASQFEKEIHGAAYLEREPLQADAIASGKPARLVADGEVVLISENTKRTWPSEVPEIKSVLPNNGEARRYVGRQVKYTGVRQPDGRVIAETIELATAPPADAYKIPGDRVIGRNKDKQTGIDILEVRKGNKIEGRMKLFPVEEVQQYLTNLGRKLLPPQNDVTARALEFRFYVVEDPSINAASLPDGTILINTGLLGAVENESQLAFVISHEIAHVLQAHYWREVTETRSKRVLITIAAIAGSGFIGDVSLFLGQMGLAAVVNGYSRRIENQADRVAMQNLIDLGYDPRTAIGFFRLMIDRYSDRSTSALWSSHDSSLLRGSFLTVQLGRQYPEGHFDKAITQTDGFTTMKDVMGPVKVM